MSYPQVCALVAVIIAALLALASWYLTAPDETTGRHRAPRGRRGGAR